MAYRITLIPGDGIGPEVSSVAQSCLNVTRVPIQWEIVPAGKASIAQYGSPLSENVLNSIKRNKVALKGPVTTPIGKGYRSVNVQLRQNLDLYANVRPCRIYPGIVTPFKQVDLVLIRENTEDLYAGIEYAEGAQETDELIGWVRAHGGKTINQDSAISLKAISRKSSERIIRFAFEYALKYGRKKVTAVHKANIMKYTDGLFLEVFHKVASEYQGRVACEDQLVDSLCMRLVQLPESYDVLVLPNLYGDIVSDLCAGLIGGLGVAPGANLGDDIAVFEPVHGSAPQMEGQNKANPTAMILSGVLMLRYLGEPKAADLLEWAVSEVLCEGHFVTCDVKTETGVCGTGTREMADAIIQKIKLRQMEQKNAACGGSKHGK